MILRSLLACLLLGTVALAAGEDATAAEPPIDPQQAVLVIDDLAARGALDPAVAASERARWQERIQPARGVRILVWALAGIILAGSGIALLHRHIWPLLRRISPVSYEILVWSLCAGVIAWAWRVGPPGAGLAALPGLLGLVGALAFTLRLHASDWCTAHPAATGRLAACGLAVAWSAAAIALSSTLVGWLAACGMLAALGFIAAAGLGWIGVGFAGRHAVPVGTAGAAVMAALGLLLHLPAVAEGPWRWLLPGVGGLGAAACLLGLLILANGWYRGNDGRWWLWNGLALAAMLGCAWLGDRLGDGYLKGLGATMTCILLLQKYCEEVWRRRWWLPGLFGLGLLLWGLSWLLARHPGLFLATP